MAQSEPAKRRRNLVVLNAASSVQAPRGRVWLLGAGPGDPDLLTVRAARVLSGAHVLVHDGLVSAEILNLAPAEARRINVAKRKSHHTYPQEEINRMLVAFALEGLEVVRLKGGDPFVFGRGGEELEACRAAGVACEVVPGVTAALAAAASAGAPLTHRGLAQAVTFVTAHARADAEPDLDWAALSRANQTVAVYMGLSQAGAVSRRLIAAGRASETPVLVVVGASLADEQRRLTTLGRLEAVARDLSGAAIIIIGEAMALARTQSDPAVSLGAVEDLLRVAG